MGKVLVGSGVVVLVAGIAACWHGVVGPQQGIYNTILFLTFLVLLAYTWETHKLRTETQTMAKETRQLRKNEMEAHTFAALSAIHRSVSEGESFLLRQYVTTSFDDYLVSAVGAILGPECVCENKVNVEAIRSKFGQGKDREQKLGVLTFRLLAPAGFEDGINRSALYAVEGTLEVFDAIALPVLEGITAARKAAEAYKIVLERTAPHLLPYVEVQRILRADPGYRSAYVDLLKVLDIDLSPLREAPD